MKRSMSCAAAVFLVVMLAGCASTRTSRIADEKIVVDQEYVQAVNYASRQSGVRVTWINPPTKRVPVDSDINR
jgi:hypothetical protein